METLSERYLMPREPRVVGCRRGAGKYRDGGQERRPRPRANGTYRFSNVPVGVYTVTVALQVCGVAGQGRSGGAEQDHHGERYTATGGGKDRRDCVEAPALLDTTTAQIGTTYSAREAEELAIAANAGNGALNLALLGGGVASSGGVGAGAGPSVGGQRPRSNNFTVEGVDDNRKDITGPTTLVPNDAVAEFTSLQNQYSAEFGHSGGGQFNTVIKNGGNVISRLAVRISSEPQFERRGSVFGTARVFVPTRATTTIASEERSAVRSARTRCSTTDCLKTIRWAMPALCRRPCGRRPRQDTRL